MRGRWLPSAVLTVAVALAAMHHGGRADGGAQDLFFDGYALLQAGKPAEAAEKFESGLQQEPDNALVHYLLGESYLAIGKRDAAIESLRAAVESDPASEAGRNARTRLADIPGYRLARGPLATLPPGSEFRDCEVCPSMVIVPAGKGLVGSPAGEAGRSDDESPQHAVNVSRPFALARHEVSYAEWDACVRARACAAPADPGWGRGARPVVNVSWQDARAYVTWLARKTGRPYRLPSEAEWEYAARGGVPQSRYWGDALERACMFANVYDVSASRKYNDQRPAFGCDDVHTETALGGQFKPNRFGLHDMLGNVWEWVSDCYHASYQGAPVDGSAWEHGECSSRVIRGGSWDNGPSDVRAARRAAHPVDTRIVDLGFRVARTLP